MNFAAAFLPAILSLAAFSSCSGGGGSDDTNGAPQDGERDFRADMRQFVQAISAQAKARRPGFLVIPQNGLELLTLDGTDGGPLASAYADAIDGVGREDLFYGFDNDNEPTPPVDRDYLLGFCERARVEGIPILVTDYCSTLAFVDDSYLQNFNQGLLSFAAPARELDVVPLYPAQIARRNNGNVDSLAQVQNFLYLLNPDTLVTTLGRSGHLTSLQNTGYDLLLLDAFIDGTVLTATEGATLATKPGGGRRLRIAYMSIGEAEDYRFYWNPAWTTAPPAWLAAQNPDFPGNFKVRYWDPEWQAIVLGPGGYLDRIQQAGFDGVYLDLIDAFEFFEGD